MQASQTLRHAVLGTKKQVSKKLMIIETEITSIGSAEVMHSAYLCRVQTTHSHKNRSPSLLSKSLNV